MRKIPFDLEKPASPVVLRPITSRYKRISAREFKDEPARLTKRQSLFYRNLLELANGLQSNKLPIEIETPTQGRLYLDRGCIKIAVNAGFLRPLIEDPTGEVSMIELAWDATGERRI